MWSSTRSERGPAGALMLVAVSAGMALLGSGQAVAGPDVDIESLRGELWRASGEWLLEVRYDVEIEDYRPPPGDLELILYVTEHDYTLVDQAGRPIEFVVPLVHPSEVDDDELEFEDRLIVTLPDGVFGNPDRLRLEGIVVRVGDDYALDRKGKSIKFDHEYPERRSHYGVRASVAVGVSVRPVLHHRVVYAHRAVHRRTELVRRVSAATQRVGVVQRRPSVGHQRISAGQRRVGVQHRISRARQHTAIGHRRAAVGSRTRGR
jgi:hypothetical protein